MHCLASVVPALKSVKGSKTMTKEQILSFSSLDEKTSLEFGVGLNVFAGLGFSITLSKNLNTFRRLFLPQLLLQRILRLH